MISKLMAALERRRAEADQSPWKTGEWKDIRRSVKKAQAVHELKRREKRASKLERRRKRGLS